MIHLRMDKAPQAPLTRDEISLLLIHIGWPVSNPQVMELTFKLARLIEQAHGITMDDKAKSLKHQEDLEDAN